MGIFKNLFASKKPEAIPEVLKYSCWVIKYFNPDADADDEVREAYFAKFKVLNQVYTDEDLDQISEKAFMNVRECFYWFTSKPHKTSSIRNVYKFQSVNEGVDPINKEAIEKAFKELKPLTRVDIQTLKRDLQFEVYNNCKFLSISEVTRVVDDREEIFYFRT